MFHGPVLILGHKLLSKRSPALFPALLCWALNWYEWGVGAVCLVSAFFKTAAEWQCKISSVCVKRAHFMRVWKVSNRILIVFFWLLWHHTKCEVYSCTAYLQYLWLYVSMQSENCKYARRYDNVFVAGSDNPPLGKHRIRSTFAYIPHTYQW